MFFRKPLFIRTILSAVLLPGALLAGIPVDEKLRCPFGNETVKFTSTSSCTIYGNERGMSFAPRTSCDFVEQMPQCTKTKVPLYKEFSRDEVKVLKAFAKTDEYAAAAALSRFYLAYVIEAKLNPENSEAHFSLLLSGLWYDSARTYGNAEYFTAFAAAANQRLKAGDADEKAFVMATSSYAALMMGKTDNARELIRAVRGSPAARDTLLLPYVAAVEKCLKSRQSEACQPDATITFDE